MTHPSGDKKQNTKIKRSCQSSFSHTHTFNIFWYTANEHLHTCQVRVSKISIEMSGLIKVSRFIDQSFCLCQGGRVLLSMDCDVHPLFPGLLGCWFLRWILWGHQSVIAQWYPNDCYGKIAENHLANPKPNLRIFRIRKEPFLFQNQDSKPSNSKTFQESVQIHPAPGPLPSVFVEAVAHGHAGLLCDPPSGKKWVWDLLAAVRTIGDWAVRRCGEDFSPQSAGKWRVL